MKGDTTIARGLRWRRYACDYWERRLCRISTYYIEITSRRLGGVVPHHLRLLQLNKILGGTKVKEAHKD